VVDVCKHLYLAVSVDLLAGQVYSGTLKNCTQVLPTQLIYYCWFLARLQWSVIIALVRQQTTGLQIRRFVNHLPNSSSPFSQNPSTHLSTSYMFYMHSKTKARSDVFKAVP